MSSNTGKAKHPHNTRRPSPKAVQKALAKGDMEALRLALTPRQVAFCREYVVDFNGAAAAVRAGYAPKNADRQAYLLQMNEGVRTYIEHLQLSHAAKAVDINPDWVTSETVKTYQEADKAADKLRALELMSKILGMLKDRTEISGPDGEAIRIQNEEIEKETLALQNLFDTLSKKKVVYTERPDEDQKA